MTVQPSPPSPIGRRLGKYSVAPSTFYKVWTEKSKAGKAEGAAEMQEEQAGPC